MPKFRRFSVPLKAGVRTTEFFAFLLLNLGSQAILAIQGDPLLSHGTVNLAKWSAGIYTAQRGLLKLTALLKGLGVASPSDTPAADAFPSVPVAGVPPVPDRGQPGTPAGAAPTPGAGSAS